MTNIFKDFINLYPISKTLRFELKPIGNTLEKIQNDNLLINDKLRAENYSKIKIIIDDFHKDFISKSIKKSEIKWDSLQHAIELYRKDNSEKNKRELEKLQKQFRGEIVKCFEADKAVYPYLFKKELITNVLPEYLIQKEHSKDDLTILNSFSKFATYFTNFQESRKNIYSKDEISTAISYRLVHENFPKFISNIGVFKDIEIKAPNIITDTERELTDILKGKKLKEIFNVEYYNNVLHQSGIDFYKNCIGGYSLKDGTEKRKGLNEFINQFNQNNTENKLPKMTALFNQILSDRQSISFIPDKFENDIEVKSAVNGFCSLLFQEKSLEFDDEFIQILNNCNKSNVYVNRQELANLSKVLTGDWRTISDSLLFYATSNSTVKNAEKWMKSSEFDYKTINDALLMSGNGLEIKDLADTINKYFVNAKAKYEEAKEYLCSNKEFLGNKSGIETVKNLLDAIMKFMHILKAFDVSNELDKDKSFYSAIDPVFNYFSEFIQLYNKVRNYATQKPYSEEKYKLTFGCSSFLSGWAKDYDTNGCLIIEKNEKYYLCIIKKKLSDEDVEFLKSDYKKDPAIRYIYDFQKPDNKNTPRLFIRSKGSSYAPAVEKYNLPIDDIIDIYDSGKFKTENRDKNPDEFKKSLVAIIDYFKLGFSRHESYKRYNFRWKNSEEYDDISEFYKELQSFCYQLYKENINFSNLSQLINANKIYLFQIYNKDFASGATGTPNLHTLYWKNIFSQQNLEDTVFKLNGEAELFYRSASIKNPFAHKKGDFLVNKKDIDNKPIPDNIYAELYGFYNGGSELSEEAMKYKSRAIVRKVKHEIIKDRRFTEPKFLFHVPVTINFKATGSGRINSKVLNTIKNNPDVNIIGIDRGERNLLYISLVNQNREIIKQKSFNVAGSFDYASKLAQYEENRDEARKNWKQIGKIKELKEGYLSVVIHEIIQMMLDNNAILVMEDLNFGFKRSRFKFERQVYQKFEKMLIDKLNYLSDKKKPITEAGGVLRGYQLTEAFSTFKAMGKQNGFIFYVPAGYTSKIDPTTGFVSLLNLKWRGIENAQEIISNLDFIRYNYSKEYFEFGLDYDKLKTTQTDYTKEWTVCTFGDRYAHSFNKETGKHISEKINLTLKIKDILNKYNIDYSQGKDIRSLLCKSDSKELLNTVLYVLKLAMQMRSTSSADDIDIIISPVLNDKNKFFISGEEPNLPIDADANGAYHIAVKGLMYMNRIKDGKIEAFEKGMSTYEWLKFMQNNKTKA